MTTPKLAELARDTIDTALGARTICRLDRLEGVDGLPYCIKVLLEACLRHLDGHVVTEDDVKVDEALYRRIADEELARLEASVGADAFAAGHYAQARQLLDQLVLAPTCADFLTVPAYQLID